MKLPMKHMVSILSFRDRLVKGSADEACLIRTERTSAQTGLPLCLLITCQVITVNCV